MEKRYLTDTIAKATQDRMVFLGGPRQVGKTVLSLAWLQADNANDKRYLNWDAPGVSKQLREGKLPIDANKVVLDEIHNTIAGATL